MKLILFFFIGLNFLFAEEIANNLVCEVLGEGSKRIQCTFFTERIDHDRNITFEWKSPSLAEDHRERTVMLNAHHGSIYDFRYYYGRSPGEWRVCAKEGDVKLGETTFIIEEKDEEEY
jgi:hypothetical protein